MRRFRSLAFSALVLLVPGLLAANDRVRSVQQSLQELGFYNGPLNGNLDAETKGALRRFQIYKGLEASGALDAATGEALSSASVETGANSASGAARPNAAEEPERLAIQPTPAAPPAAVEQSDRDFLRRQTDGSPPAPPAAPPAASRPGPPPVSGGASAGFAVLFRGTPFGSAPAEVQRDTLLKAQTILARRGLYDAMPDGLPGPETEEALFRFQSASRLPRTGRLDLDTLAALRLLPVSGVPLEPFRGGGAPPVYQGRLPREGDAPAGAVRGIPLD